jgi:hypothetical protein
VTKTFSPQPLARITVPSAKAGAASRSNIKARGDLRIAAILSGKPSIVIPAREHGSRTRNP